MTIISLMMFVQNQVLYQELNQDPRSPEFENQGSNKMKGNLVSILNPEPNKDTNIINFENY